MQRHATLVKSQKTHLRAWRISASTNLGVAAVFDKNIG